VRLTPAEKREVIRLVEGSDLSVRQTLQELCVNRATFYAWYRRYRAEGDAGLTPKPAAARQYWNRIPPPIRVNDAMWIADLLAHGLIRGSFVPPTPIQELRGLTRTRKPRADCADGSGRSANAATHICACS
jgi:hypothetical protein